MKFSISSAVFDKLKMPYSVAFLVVSELKVRKGAEAKIEAMMKGEVLDQVKANSKLNKEVLSLYEKAFKVLKIEGAKVSLANMLGQLEKGKSLFLGNPLIDFYNSFVLKSRIPAGAYDLDRVVGDVSLRFSGAVDKFKQLGKDSFVEIKDSLVLADEAEVLCNDWVSKQSDTQKIRPVTKNVLFRLEGLGLDSEQMKAQVEKFKTELAELFEFDFVEFVVLDSGQTEAEISLPKEVEVRRKNYEDAVELLTRGVSQVVVYEDVLQSLIEGKKLRIKHGVDPTTKDLHLGYAVNYEKMRQFQERGHTIIFLIGSFTARFGDPTDKGETRKMKEREMVLEMAQNYIRQLGRILDVDKLEIRYNGDWFDKMSAEDLLRLMSEFTVARMLERDMFAKRMKEGKEIGLHEIVYPVLQGYDSVEIESDLTVIGTDQTFNELQARPLQSSRGQTPQNIIAMQLLVGTDGKMKMSQSLGNYIGFDDAPEDKFGKLMSIPDHLIMNYFTVSTRLSRQELAEIEAELKSGVNPRDLKLRLAKEIVTIYDGAEAAIAAQNHFETVFQKKELPDEMPTYSLHEGGKFGLLEVLIDAEMASSTSEIRRLIDQGAVKVNSEKVIDLNFMFVLGEEYVIQVGKRKFLRVQ